MASSPSPSSTRDKILEVAEGLYARRGFEGVGMREVAEAAGLGKSSLFHHFRSKAQLYLAVLDRALERIELRLAPTLRGPGGHAERLERWVEVLIDSLAEQPAAARLLLRGLFEDDAFDATAWDEGRAAERRLAAVLGGVQQLLRDGMEAGAFRRASTGHTLQTLIGATVYHFASGEFGEELLGASLLASDSVRKRKEEVVTFVRSGLAPPSVRNRAEAVPRAHPNRPRPTTR